MTVEYEVVGNDRFYIYPRGKAKSIEDRIFITLLPTGRVYAAIYVRDNLVNQQDCYTRFNKEFMAPYVDTLPQEIIQMLADWARSNDEQ